MKIERETPRMLKIGDVVGTVDLAQPGLDDAAELEAPPHLDWYVVLTKPGREGQAAGNLKDQGYHCFEPLRLVEIRMPGKQRRVATVTRPLYPRYIFVGVPVGGRGLSPVYNTRGVSTVVSDAGGAMRIKDDVIGDLMFKAGSTGVLEVSEVPADHLFRDGMEVGFKPESPWAPFRGTIVRVDSNGMCKIHIDSPQRSWPLDVPYTDLLPPETG